jgi:hypothetical protein
MASATPSVNGINPTTVQLWCSVNVRDNLATTSCLTAPPAYPKVVSSDGPSTAGSGSQELEYGASL